jgi:hypothetical protein
MLFSEKEKGQGLVESALMILVLVIILSGISYFIKIETGLSILGWMNYLADYFIWIMENALSF